MHIFFCKITTKNPKKKLKKCKKVLKIVKTHKTPINTTTYANPKKYVPPLLLVFYSNFVLFRTTFVPRFKKNEKKQNYFTQIYTPLQQFTQNYNLKSAKYDQKTNIPKNV